jgi:hypothetical protein
MFMRPLIKIIASFSLAASMLICAGVNADVWQVEKPGDITKVFVRDDPWQPDDLKQGILIPATYTSGEGIFLDGIENEAAWATTPEVAVPLSFGSVDSAQLKALYTDDDILLRIRWADSTEDRLHHPWVWDEELGTYKIGPQVEDSLMLSFEAYCEWFPSFLTGYDFDFDAWRWLAGRTDPLGQALDLSGSMKDAQLSMNTLYKPRNDKNEWNLRITDLKEGILHKPWDELDRQYMIWPVLDTVYYHANLDGRRGQEFVRQIAATSLLPSSPDPVPQFEPLKIDSGGADVQAKGHWEDGFWTVELRRKRITEDGTSYDIQFKRLTQFSVQVYDHVEGLDQSSESGRLFFQFLEKEPLPLSESESDSQVASK